ncbi:prefoldin subunit 5 [Xanthomonas arboricola]|nr:prefoldin subunit 5 [Xanthomonas cannabis]
MLSFGAIFTAVQAPNGAGKTPIMKGVMQGLGHEVDLPPDVLTHCEFAQIQLSVDERTVILTRTLGAEFKIHVDDGLKEKTFTNQAEYARWFIGLFNADLPNLTSKQSQPAELYATVLLPALWVDQDHGWTTDYWTPPNRNFIRDQRQEVIRFLVGLPPRHAFRPKTEFEAAKRSLDRTERALEIQRFVVNRLRTNEQLSDSEEPGLIKRRFQLHRELEINSEAIAAIRSSSSFYNQEIEALETQRHELTVRADSLNKQKRQLSLILSELDGEEDILTANVQATDLLRQFCSQKSCQMFEMSERSFGRSLLFLKDQIKDLRASDRDLNHRVESIEIRIEQLSHAIEFKRAELGRVVDQSPQGEVAAKLNGLTKELVDVELRIARVQQYAAELGKLERLLDQREQATVAVAELRPAGIRGATASTDVRKMLSEAMQEWLVTLGTQNTKSAHFDEDFTLFVDDAKFTTTTHQSGSTRTRIVLAFHAALLEVSLARGGNHPGWLLFDAPKQHELSQVDFDAYTERLQMLAIRYPGRVQVVFSAADLKTQFQAGDEVWHASFTIDGKFRFLGDAGVQTIYSNHE